MIQRSLSLILCLLVAGCSGSTSGAGATPAGVGVAASGSTTSGSTTTRPPATAHFELVPIETVDVGSHSPRGATQGAHEVQVATDADWRFVWLSHSQAPLPGVDFRKESVVGAFMGVMPVGDHFTRVINVSRDRQSDDLRAVVREFRVGPWRPQPMILPVLPSPFHLVRCATAVSGVGALTVERQALLDFEPIRSGSDSALGAGDPTYAGGLHVLRDAAAFSALFAQVQPGVRPPGIDFKTSMVVAVLGPYVPTFGNSVETLRLVEDAASGELRVLFRVNPYRGGAAPPAATETPYQLLRVSRAKGTIRAERTSPVAQTPLASGTSSLYRGPAETLAVRDSATLAAVWSTRIGTSAPKVDFATDQVLMAFEPAGSQTQVRVAESELLEDDELSVTVTVETVFGLPITGAPYSVVTTPRNMGPVRFETIDITPRP